MGRKACGRQEIGSLLVGLPPFDTLRVMKDGFGFQNGQGHLVIVRDANGRALGWDILRAQGEFRDPRRVDGLVNVATRQVRPGVFHLKDVGVNVKLKVLTSASPKTMRDILVHHPAPWTLEEWTIHRNGALPRDLCLVESPGPPVQLGDAVLMEIMQRNVGRR